MTKSTDKKNKKRRIQKGKGEKSNDSWTVDRELMTASFVSDNPFAKDRLRELLQELQRALEHNNADEIESRKHHTSEINYKLYVKKYDIIDINERLVNFIDVQKKKQFTASTWRMPKAPLKHLIELNFQIEQLLKKIPPKWVELAKEEFDINEILDMIRRSSNEAIEE